MTVALCLSGQGCLGTEEVRPPVPFAVSVVDFAPGPGAGFGQASLPDIVLGPPRGGGDQQGSTHVVSLGHGGNIVLELGQPVIDQPGADFLVFENPFVAGSEVFAEPGLVSVSSDGARFEDFACDPAPPHAGCAGLEPVYANADVNSLDPQNPAEAGGDAFDLADVGVERVRFVQIRDLDVSPEFGAGASGFDLDAIAVVEAR